MPPTCQTRSLTFHSGHEGTFLSSVPRAAAARAAPSRRTASTFSSGVIDAVYDSDSQVWLMQNQTLGWTNPICLRIAPYAVSTRGKVSLEAGDAAARNV